jgi:Ca2+-binding EF-hand superfamily protein
MKKHIGYFLLPVIVFFGSSTLYADHHRNTETEQYEMKADTNNDGKVSYEEFKAAREKYMKEHFKRRDLNGDGFIDQDEKKAAKERWAQHHKKMKKDGQRMENDTSGN